MGGASSACSRVKGRYAARIGKALFSEVKLEGLASETDVVSWLLSMSRP